MMGVHQTQQDLFSYHVQLEKRVRPEHPLRQVAALIDFSFIREEVAQYYGTKGNVSVDPVIILKMLFLLFYDDVASERELMAIIAERLDYMWFLGYGLEDEIPNHSVLSKARARWGTEAFKNLFVRVVLQCVQKGLVEGKKIHVDSSLIDANASKDSVLKGPPELVSALKQAYQAQETKLADTSTPQDYQSINDRTINTTDPDAALTRKNHEPARSRYHHHRVVDDAQGVITAVETTPGSIAENKKLMALVAQHKENTQIVPQTVVADHKYGTNENFIACQKQGLQTHLGDVQAKQRHVRSQGIYPDTAFTYRPEDNTYLCPAGQVMKLRGLFRTTWTYALPKKVCASCPLRPQCTHAKIHGRTIHRHEHQELLDRARAQACSAVAQKNRRRRQELMERSFADAANNHGFKRSRWRRLWRQQIQDYLIATTQNIRILIKQVRPKLAAAAAMLVQQHNFHRRILRNAALKCWRWEFGNKLADFSWNSALIQTLED